MWHKGEKAAIVPNLIRYCYSEQYRYIDVYKGPSHEHIIMYLAKQNAAYLTFRAHTAQRKTVHNC